MQDQGGDDSLSLDLSDIEAGKATGGGDPGDIFGENTPAAKPEPTMAELL